MSSTHGASWKKFPKKAMTHIENGTQMIIKTLEGGCQNGVI
jgi:hypothetical protein